MADQIGLFLLLVVNAWSFALYLYDKRMAIAHKRRVPERTLLLWAACFGAPGALAAMYLFRHKTRKARFTAGLPVMLVLQAVALILWATR